MAYYKSGVGFIRAQPVEDSLYPRWYNMDCGCSNGLRWGGEEPVECRDCGGGGFNYVHRPTGTIADYPGGPLRGKMPEADMKRMIDARL